MDTKIKLINTLKKYKSKQENFDVLCQQTINSLESLGIDIDNISLKHNQEGNYDYMFNENQYRINQEKKIAVPLNRNKKNINFYDKFLKCTKLPIKSFVYVEDEKDKFGRSLTTKKEISQTYMIGYVNNRPYEFSFSIIKAAKNNEKLSDFSIVLSVLVSKQNNLWVELARFDSCGPAHINYFNEDGNVLEDVSQINYTPTPHIHINNDQAEIITNGVQNAYSVPEKLLKNVKNKYFFKDSVDCMFKLCNVYVKNLINPFIPEDYNFHENLNILNEQVLSLPENLEEYKMYKNILLNLSSVKNNYGMSLD